MILYSKLLQTPISVRVKARAFTMAYKATGPSPCPLAPALQLRASHLALQAHPNLPAVQSCF